MLEWLYSTWGRVLPPHISAAPLLLFLFPTNSVLEAGGTRVLTGGWTDLFSQFLLRGSLVFCFPEEHPPVSRASLCGREVMLKQCRVSCVLDSGDPG